MKVSPDVLRVLDHATIEGAAVSFGGPLDRNLYGRVNKVLEAAGGRWDRKAKAHLFDGDAAVALEPLFLTGIIVDAKQDFGAFTTPPAVASLVMERAGLAPGLAVLEPSAGRGALAAPALLAGCAVDCVEIDPRSVKILCSTAYRQVVEADFLTLPATPVYDRVIMNPPFAGSQDVAHVLHARRFLRPGGRLVAVMAAGITFRAGRGYETIREAASGPGGSIALLPADAFRPAGTAVRTALVILGAAS